MGYLTLATEIDAHRVGFLHSIHVHRIRVTIYLVMNFLYDVFGTCELQVLLNRY